jgi:ribosome-associated protein
LSKTQKQVKEQKTTFDTLNELIIDAIQDIKGLNIVQLDLCDLEDRPTDYFIICEGESTTQVKAIANRIYRKVRDEHGVRPNHVEGGEGSKWILVDFFNIVVHIFYPETRKFYDIEDLWSDAKKTSYENI